MPKLESDELFAFAVLLFFLTLAMLCCVGAGLEQYYDHVENMKKIECGQLAEEKK